ncbi:MAG: PH domain-containing protein [Coriobacteriia bacterium]|nr:PH domain-containing protein [Coriobacteriia bacterium]
MSYVEKELNEGESVIYMGRVSAWTLAPRTLLALALLAVAAVVAAFLSALNVVFWAVSVSVIVLLWVFMVARALLRIATTEFAITDRRVMSKTGFMRTEVKSTPLDKVNNINVTQSLVGNMLDYGDIEVTTATTEAKDNHSVAALARPDEFRNRLSRQMGQS